MTKLRLALTTAAFALVALIGTVAVESAAPEGAPIAAPTAGAILTGCTSFTTANPQGAYGLCQYENPYLAPYYNRYAVKVRCGTALLPDVTVQGLWRNVNQLGSQVSCPVGYHAELAWLIFLTV